LKEGALLKLLNNPGSKSEGFKFLIDHINKGFINHDQRDQKPKFEKKGEKTKRNN